MFNVEQIEGLPAHFHAVAEPRLDPVQRIERAEEFLCQHQSRYPPWRQHGLLQYRLPTSCRCRPFEAFRDAESYYATLAHECTHWTRHQSRLDRDLGRKKWGDAGYAMEELVAELGSAFLCADLDLTPEVREDHAAYIASGWRCLKNDKRAIFSAAAHAQKAADYLTRLQPKSSEQAAA